MDYNYHTHTTRCHHAVNSDEEYIQAAIEAGIKYLGFSDHAPVVFAARLLGKAGDGEMAALYRRIGGRKAAQDKLFRKVKAAPVPAGHWSFNYAAMGVHRFKNKAVTMKTFNHYVWAYET